MARRIGVFYHWNDNLIGTTLSYYRLALDLFLEVKSQVQGEQAHEIMSALHRSMDKLNRGRLCERDFHKEKVKVYRAAVDALNAIYSSDKEHSVSPVARAATSSASTSGASCTALQRTPAAVMLVHAEGLQAGGKRKRNDAGRQGDRYVGNTAWTSSSTFGAAAPSGSDGQDEVNQHHHRQTGEDGSKRYRRR